MRFKGIGLDHLPPCPRPTPTLASITMAKACFVAAYTAPRATYAHAGGQVRRDNRRSRRSEIVKETVYNATQSSMEVIDLTGSPMCDEVLDISFKAPVASNGSWPPPAHVEVMCMWDFGPEDYGPSGELIMDSSMFSQPRSVECRKTAGQGAAKRRLVWEDNELGEWCLEHSSEPIFASSMPSQPSYGVKRKLDCATSNEDTELVICENPSKRSRMGGNPSRGTSAEGASPIATNAASEPFMMTDISNIGPAGLGKEVPPQVHYFGDDGDYYWLSDEGQDYPSDQGEDCHSVDGVLEDDEDYYCPYDQGQDCPSDQGEDCHSVDGVLEDDEDYYCPYDQGQDCPSDQGEDCHSVDGVLEDNEDYYCPYDQGQDCHSDQGEDCHSVDGVLEDDEDYYCPNDQGQDCPSDQGEDCHSVFGVLEDDGVALERHAWMDAQIQSDIHAWEAVYRTLPQSEWYYRFLSRQSCWQTDATFCL
eukprot:gene22030-29091_t